MAQPTSVEKETSTHQHEAPLQEKEQVHFDTDMADLEIHEEEKSPENIINKKEYEIRYLKDKLSKEKFMITFLQ